MTKRSRRAAGRRANEQLHRMAIEIRNARSSLALSRNQVARLASVAPSTVQRLEAGSLDTGVGTLVDVMMAVGLNLVLNAYPGRGPRLRDSGQLELAAQLLGLAAPYWTGRLEVSAGQHGESADLVLYGAEEVIHIEIERRIVDLQGQLRPALRKREVIASRTDRPVRLVMAIEDGRRNRAVIELHLPLIRRSFPADSRAVLAALRSGRPLESDGLLWLRRKR